MNPRPLTIAILAATTLARPTNRGPHFAIGTSGAITVNAVGADARYEVNTAGGNERPMLTVSLGSRDPRGCLMLSLAGDRLPPKGRYSILQWWNEQATNGSSIHASFVAGSPEHPLGWFEGESGWVTITESVAGEVSGEFEVRARGFLSATPENENQWVTVRGSFQARGDSTITTLASVQ